MNAALVLIACALIGGFIGGFFGYAIMYKSWKTDKEEGFFNRLNRDKETDMDSSVSDSPMNLLGIDEEESE